MITAMLAAAALGAAPSVVCLGDSITAGMNARTPYPQILGGLLAGQAVVHDGGVSGDRTSDLMVRWTGTWRKRHAAWIVLLIGVNDVNLGVPLPAAEANISRILDEAREDGSRVLAVTLLPEKGSPYWNDRVQERLIEVNRFIRAEAARRHLPLLDAYPEFAGREPDALAPRFDSGDHLHPNSAGAERLASLVAAALRKAGL